MNLLKELVAFLAILALSACASAPQTTYVNNEAVPGKTYTLQSTAMPIGTTTLFYAVVPIKDLDGSVNTVSYLTLNENLNFSRTEVEGLYARIAVSNPTKATYTVKYNLTTIFADGTLKGEHITVGKSALEQRTYTIPVPIQAKMMKASFYVYLVDDKGQELLRVGDLRYGMMFPIVSSTNVPR